MAKNKLLFRTPREGVSLRPGTSRVITQNNNNENNENQQENNEQNRRRNRGIDVRKFETIRVVADNRSTSVSDVIISLLITEHGRTVGRLDRIRLNPGESFTNTYTVPGRFLNIRAFATRNVNCRSQNNRRVDTIDVRVFGHK
ncbi:hypothetical protein I6N90_14695 [Paenibacillus sp. GSMTC-2017]|uniref:hypothetical protein n=1 Tax=Paenibacillus sp. GSMTC-2017 TaxID=2794350 RepID=UPI0018D6C422|nr:hypothetical protein [Paenibacillus sp. GSMTC-2017]MBH5319052.1 hypothetical protein [Paenibacillus sp. GSMTC-2017]